MSTNSGSLQADSASGGIAIGCAGVAVVDVEVIRGTVLRGGGRSMVGVFAIVVVFSAGR